MTSLVKHKARNAQGFFLRKIQKKACHKVRFRATLSPPRESGSHHHSTTTMYNPAANIKSIRTANAEISKLQTMISDALYSCDCYEMENLEREVLTLTKYLVEKAHEMMKDTSKTLSDIEQSYGDPALIEQADTVGAYALAVISDAI